MAHQTKDAVGLFQDLRKWKDLAKIQIKQRLMSSKQSQAVCEGISIRLGSWGADSEFRFLGNDRVKGNVDCCAPTSLSLHMA